MVHDIVVNLLYNNQEIKTANQNEQEMREINERGKIVQWVLAYM